MSDTIPLPAAVRDGLGNGNPLMSLPTSLIHCILSDWLYVVALIRLDFAFCGDAEFHLQLLDILKSDLFHVKKLERPVNLPLDDIPPWENPYTHMLDWIFRRHLKVVHIELHELCSHVVLETFLQKYGEHVRHISPYEDYVRMNNDHPFPTQSELIEKYCRNLTAYVVDSYEAHDGCHLRVLYNNPHLGKLSINGPLDEGNDPITHPIVTLHHLRQLQWAENYEFTNSLVALVRAAPYLQQLRIFCYVEPINEIDGDLVVKVARACPHLRTLSCSELHFGPSDSFLQPFIAACRDIVNLDLNMHDELTEDVLIQALGELNSLHSLNLRGCSRFTDRTLQFLAQRFASTLKMLYLDYSMVRRRIYEPGTKQGNYTAAGITSLRAHCIHLHTFHYSMEATGNVPTPPLDVYRSVTIVHLFSGYEAFLPMILEHCQQLQILTMSPVAGCGWLSADQLMSIAARCSLLHTVSIGKKYAYRKDDKEVDYSEVKKAFPKLLFTHDAAVVYFDVFEVPV